MRVMMLFKKKDVCIKKLLRRSNHERCKRENHQVVSAGLFGRSRV
jgi:hypothetical protein